MTLHAGPKESGLEAATWAGEAVQRADTVTAVAVHGWAWAGPGPVHVTRDLAMRLTIVVLAHRWQLYSNEWEGG